MEPKTLGDMLRPLRRPTLRLRMTLWTSALLIITASLLVLFITVGTTIRVPKTLFISTMETLDPQAKAELAELMAKSMNDPEMTEHLKRLVMTLPIKGTDKGTDLMKNLPVTGELPAKAVITNGKQLPNVLFSGDLSQAVLGQIRLLSLIGLVLVILFGSMGTYWVTGMALRPVQQLSARIQSIDSTSLAARLPDEGPEDEVKK